VEGGGVRWESGGPARRGLAELRLRHHLFNSAQSAIDYNTS
jgi:hypothetical protein